MTMSDQPTIPEPNDPDTPSRQSFEAWIGGPPYERDLYRWPMDDTMHAWPGHYRDIAVQLAWEAWCEATETKHTHTPT